MDRSGKRIQLFVNGEDEGVGADPVESIPNGGWIGFFSSAGDGSKCEISELVVGEWSPGQRRDPAAERGDKSKDALVSADGERYAGSLLKAVPGEEGMVFHFAADGETEEFEVPVEAVSSIHLTEPPSKQPDEGDSFHLRLLGGGSLRVAGCSFTPEEVIARHPLLGEIRLDRAAVSSFERPQPKPEEQPQTPQK